MTVFLIISERKEREREENQRERERDGELEARNDRVKRYSKHFTYMIRHIGGKNRQSMKARINYVD